jgi:quercetin dioxygenase-like cupin family protein
MKIYRSMPRELVDGWVTRSVRHAGGEQVAWHYHGVEEWLEVLEGDVCFVSAGGDEYPLSAGEALHIPQGEVHRVRIGPSGVAYQMWLPAEVSEEGFAHTLDAESVALVERNLAVPQTEDSEDRAVFRRFFEDFLSAEFLFRTAPGALLPREEFLGRPAGDVRRESSRSVRILHQGPKSVLLSTLVHTSPKSGGPRRSFVNLRLFVPERDGWRCRAWLNYPDEASR